MEVKGILDKIRQQEEKKKEYFFALEIGVGIVKSAVWMVEKEKIKVVAIGTSESCEGEEELLDAIDITLSSAAEEFTPEAEIAEPNKVIFGLSADWIEEDKIIPEKLKILKNLSQKLELEPVGFVITTEAIAHYLKTTEGVPPTAILVALAKTRISLTLLRLGKSSPSQLVERSQNLGNDVIEGLSRYEEKESLPARILLYDSEEKFEEVRQNLVDYPWQEEKVREKEVTFLHLPKIEILSPDFDIKAVALAGGKEVARAAGIMADFVEKKEKPVSSPIEEKEKALELVDFGFVKGKDILEEKRKEIEPKKIVEEVVAKIPLPSPDLSRLSKINFSRFFSFFSKLLSKISFENRAPLIVGVVLAILFVLGGVMIALYWHLPRASIVLLVEPRVLEEEFEIKLDPSLTISDKERFALPAQEVEETVRGEKTVGTTGTKITGEKARGEVTIYNGTPKEKMFKSEMAITSLGGLEFTLDDDVTVASQSSAADPSGKSVVKVAATKIGTEGNLAAGSEFTIANYAKFDYVAKNESAFTGGTSREIQVVAAEDQEKLLAGLIKELEVQAISQIEAKIPLRKKLLKESLKSLVIDKVFSKGVDEEATEISLSLKSKLTALFYSEDELHTLVCEVIEDKIPAGFEFKKEESKTRFELKEVTPKGIALFEAKLLVNLIPQINLEEVKKNLVGKYPQLGKAYLDNLPNVAATEIKITPQLPGRLLTFPRIAKNINIEVRIK